MGDRVLGFLILSHSDWRQVLRLTQTLSQLYDSPPIVCHHDTSQSPIEAQRFGPNVHFVPNPIKTGWAKWSLVEATLRALAVLYDRADPAWFTLLSAADYPIAKAEDVLSELQASPHDVLMDYRLVPKSGMSTPPAGSLASLQHHGSESNMALARDRYRKAIVKYPVLRFNPPLYSSTKQHGWRVGRETVALPFEPPMTPFSGKVECYVGSQWLSANRRTAKRILERSQLHRALERHLRSRVVPDECFFQSLLCNQNDLSVDADPRRYADWGGGGAHPMSLDEAALASAFASGAHFARKFAADAPALDVIDRRLLGVATAGGQAHVTR
jgi:hypothetical protein